MKQFNRHTRQKINIGDYLRSFLGTFVILLIIFNFPLLVNFEASNLYPTLNKSNYSTIPRNSEISTGQAVIDYYRQVFQSDWARGENYDPNLDGLGFAQSYDRDGSGYQPYEAQTIEAEMTITPILSPDNSESNIINLINKANESLLIEQMYIYSTLTEIINAIIAAHNRGVNCCIIVDAISDESNATAFTLTQQGIHVKICDGTVPMYFDTQHNKGVIVDGILTLISSINWSPTSLRENREAGLIIESTTVSAYYKMLFNHDWDVCEDYNAMTSFEAYSLGIPEVATTTSLNIDSIQFPQDSAYNNEFENTQQFSGLVNVTMMASPDNCYEVVAELLAQAKESIDISVYTFSSPYLMDILLDRLANGVQIRLLLEKYQVSSYERNYNRWTMYNLTQLGTPLQTNSEVNVTAQGLWADSDFDFQHSKYAIVDNKTLILSSGNWGRSSCPNPQDDGDVDGNRDWWIAIYGNNPGDLPASQTTTSTTSQNTELDIPWYEDEELLYTYFAIIGGIAVAIGATIFILIKKLS